MSRFAREYAAYQGGKADAYTKDAIRTFAGIRAAAERARAEDHKAFVAQSTHHRFAHHYAANAIREAIRAALHAAESVEFEVKP